MHSANRSHIVCIALKLLYALESAQFGCRCFVPLLLALLNAQFVVLSRRLISVHHLCVRIYCRLCAFRIIFTFLCRALFILPFLRRFSLFHFVRTFRVSHFIICCYYYRHQTRILIVFFPFLFAKSASRLFCFLFSYSDEILHCTSARMRRTLECGLCE